MSFLLTCSYVSWFDIFTCIREGGSVFSVIDIKEMDAQVSSFYDFGAVEAGPLLLAWAVFLSLLLSLHETHNSSTLMVNTIRFPSFCSSLYNVLCIDTFFRRLIMSVMFAKHLRLQHLIIYLRFFAMTHSEILM